MNTPDSELHYSPFLDNLEYCPAYSYLLMIQIRMKLNDYKQILSLRHIRSFINRTSITYEYIYPGIS